MIGAARAIFKSLQHFDYSSDPYVITSLGLEVEKAWEWYPENDHGPFTHSFSPVFDHLRHFTVAHADVEGETK
jgi:hypothetical protein